VAVLGNIAYVAGGRWGVNGVGIIDVSNPFDPQELGWYGADYYNDIAIRGSHAYVTRWKYGLEVLDLSDPLNPSKVGRLPLVDASQVLMSDRYAYVGAANGVHVIDVSDAAQPVRVGGNSAFNSSPGYGLGSFYSGLSLLDNALVAAPDGDVIIFDKFTELRIGPASVDVGGEIRLPINGRCGQRVTLQRSSNLVDWEDWQTMTLGGEGCGLIDRTDQGPQLFYRIVED